MSSSLLFNVKQALMPWRSPEGKPLNAQNLAEVPPVNPNEIGLRKYVLAPPHEEPYYLPAQVSGHETHDRRLAEQIADIEQLMKRR